MIAVVVAAPPPRFLRIEAGNSGRKLTTKTSRLQP